MTFDVCVLGAGPAGATAAALLAGRGARVLLLERARFPRDKPCGGCVSPAAVRFLRAHGLAAALAGGRPLTRFRLNDASLPFDGGIAVSRHAFDSALVVQAQARGAVFEDGVRATLADARARAAVVLDARGLGGGAVAKGALVGAAATYDDPAHEPGAVHLRWARGGYAGTVRAEGDRVLVAAAVPAAEARDLDAAVRARAKDLPRGLRWRATPPLTRRAPPAPQERVLRVGDARAFVEPFTGEGIAWALQSAAAAARALEHGWHAHVPAAYENALRPVRRAQRRCRAVTLGLRVPGAAGALAALVAKAPRLARPLVHSVR